MSTVQILYKQYQSLPEAIKNELKELILNDSNKKTTLKEQIVAGLNDVKSIKNGTVKPLTLSEIFDE